MSEPSPGAVIRGKFRPARPEVQEAVLLGEGVVGIREAIRAAREVQWEHCGGMQSHEHRAILPGQRKKQ